MNTAKAVFGLALLGAAGVSHAGFIAIDDDLLAPQSTISVVSSNNFKSTLDGLGVKEYTLGASLGVTEAGSVTYYYYGKEAGYKNTFYAGDLSHTSGFTPTLQNYFGAPVIIGAVDVSPERLLDFKFCSNAGSGIFGCVTNDENDGLGFLSSQSIAMNITSNTAWLFWDDSGAGPDDNHDDMLIKAVFTARAVPEPGTLALFGLSLLGLGLGMRRKQGC